MDHVLLLTLPALFTVSAFILADMKSRSCAQEPAPARVKTGYGNGTTAARPVDRR